MNRILLVGLFAFGLSLSVASRAHATPFVIGGIAYAETSPSETVTASFLTPDGGVTTNSYNGLVEVVVSGVGQSAATDFNDAFYVYDPGPATADPNFYQLTNGGITLVGLNPAQDEKNFIVYDIDANSEVLSRPYVPAYRPDHTYSFIIDTSLLGIVAPETLHFGVSDGDFNDNSGSFTAEVTQLAPAPVPEPATLTLLGTALAGFGARRWRSRRSR